MSLVAAGTVLLTIAFLVLVPADSRAGWAEIPLAGLIRHLSTAGWVRAVLQVALGVTTLLFLVPAIQACMVDAGQLLRRLAATGVLPEALAMPHPRLGTLTKSLDVVTAASVLLVLTSAGRVAWLAGAYATAIAATLALRALAIARLRRTGMDGLPAPGPAVAPSRRRGALGPTIVAVSMAAVTAFMLARGEGAWLAAAALVLGLALLLSRRSQRAEDEGLGEAEGFELLASSAIAVEDAHAQPGNILVAVRHPLALEHVAAALQGGADREVVVMTVRLHGVDTDGASPDDPTPLPAERHLFARVITLVERYGRPVRLLVVPAATVADGLATAVVRLKSSAVYVGESATLSSADQARLLGEAWERISKPEPLDVRLVVHHRSGRADTYYLGAHLPAFTPGDLDLIHRVWREATRVIGPHVHHHDVVRAALTHMEAQLNGPDRDDALARIRDTARPAEELAAVIRARDFTRLRDMVRNRPSSDVAQVLTALGLEDQVVAFRVLPRKDAAAVFEYLTHESQEALLKAMAQEDVAALLNDMAHDDRTMFLEELPAAATRAAADAPDARRAGGGRQPARLSRGIDRTADDAALRGGPRAVDGARGARLRTPPRTGQRNAEHALRRGRPRRAHRRHPHPRVPADRSGSPRGRPDGPPLRGPQGHRRPGHGGRRLPQARSRGAARHRHRRHADRHRHHRRRARRGRSGGDSRDPAHRRIGGPRRAVHEDRLRADDPEARRLADRAVPRRNADGHGDGLLRAGDLEGGGARAVHPADHLERRQRRLAGVHARHPRAGARRGRPRATGGG